MSSASLLCTLSCLHQRLPQQLASPSAARPPAFLPADTKALSERLGLGVGLFLALTAVQFVFTETSPTSSYIVPTQQLVLATYMLLFLIR